MGVIGIVGGCGSMKVFLLVYFIVNGDVTPVTQAEFATVEKCLAAAEAFDREIDKRRPLLTMGRKPPACIEVEKDAPIN
jgi:hypothetical protein